MGGGSWYNLPTVLMHAPLNYILCGNMRSNIRIWGYTATFYLKELSLRNKIKYLNLKNMDVVNL